MDRSGGKGPTVTERSTANPRGPRRTYRRERGPGGTRATRFKVSYNTSELAVLHAAAERENTALAAWVGDAALTAAKEKLAPSAFEAIGELQELARYRNDLRRIGRDVLQIARAMHSRETLTVAELRAVLMLFDDAFRRTDVAILHVTRARRPRG